MTISIIPNLKNIPGHQLQIITFAFKSCLSTNERSSSRSSTNRKRSIWLRTHASDRSSAFIAAYLLSHPCSLKNPIVLVKSLNKLWHIEYKLVYFLVMLLWGKYFGNISPNSSHK